MKLNYLSVAIFTTLFILYLGFDIPTFGKQLNINHQEKNSSHKNRFSEYEEGPCFYVKADGLIYITKTKQFFDYGESVFKPSSFTEFEQAIKKVTLTKKQLILILVEDETKFKELKKYLTVVTDLDLLERCFIFSCCNEEQFQ